MLPNNNNANVANANYGYGQQQQTGPSGLNYIIDILKIFLFHWYWFVIGVIIAMVCCYAYLLYTPSIYTRTASIMIKNDQNNNRGGGNGQINFMSVNVDVNNEILTLTSPNIAEETVRRLHLDMNYMFLGRVQEVSIYGTALGLEVVPDTIKDNETFEFDMTVKSDRSVHMTDFKHNKVAVAGTVNCKVGDRVTTPIGPLTIKPMEGFVPSKMDLHIFRRSISQATNECLKRLTVTGGDETSTVINLRYDDYNAQRAEDVLSTIIAVYNENWVQDKNRVAISTSHFIDERLKVIQEELAEVESDISDYKSDNLIPANAEEAGSRYIGDANDAETRVTELSTQLSIMRTVKNYVLDKSHHAELIPVNLGADTGVENAIGEYNQLLLRRNNLLAASSLSNPLVQELDKRLTDQRQAILRSIDNKIGTINTEIAAAEALHNKANDKIAKSPEQARHLLSVERQQKVKESLYLYLLQKREENELSQAFTAYNTRVISAPKGSNEPTSPVAASVWVIGFILGMIVPGILLFLKENINNNIRGRHDLSELTIPFIGELPYAAHRRKLAQRISDFFNKIKRFGRPDKEDKSLHIVVKERSRNFINEAFRVVRTNIEFMSARGEKSKVIMLSSFNPNSGKTFVATNLITSFAIKKKRIIAIDLDLRKASLSAMVGKPEEGVSDYLSGIVNSYDSVIVHGVNGIETLDILPVGTIPPNPTELLFEDRLERLINELREKYDYVFIDCPPVEIVADPTIVGRHVDMTLFVIRAELFDKGMLPEVQKYYDKKMLPKMSIILNGTKSQFSYYGYGRYGYHRYGYGSYGSYGGYASK